MSEPRTYDQQCGLARSLDLLGERWTLLIVRELDRGPKRFRDLEQALPGIGTNLLSARLKRLVAIDVAGSVELAPGIPAYGLTARGGELAVLLGQLSLWGTELLEMPGPRTETRAAWAIMTIRARLDGDPRPKPLGTYAFDIEGERFWLRLTDGRSEVRDGPTPYDPDVTLTMSKPEFFAVLMGGAALGETGASVAGDRERLDALLGRVREPGSLTFAK